jgi:trans-aconitate 2-methyltransferase
VREPGEPAQPPARAPAPEVDATGGWLIIAGGLAVLMIVALAARMRRAPRAAPRKSATPVTYGRMRPRDWNATSYERVSGPLEAMGREVLDRLDLRGDERVLDAGCGTGRVTAALADRLPRGEVIAVDGSPAMVEAARERLGDSADVRVADLLELELERPVDAILSTATFHWIADHDRLFAQLLAVLRPGGRLAAQCGGAGNVAALQAAAERVGEREPFTSALAGWPGPWYFASPEETAERLTRLGWVDVWTWPHDVRVKPEDPHEYLGTVALGSHLDRLEPHLRAQFTDAVIAELDEPVADYVRLNILARRPS